MRELCDGLDNFVETQQRGRPRVQCLWAVLQIAPREQAPGHEEGRHPDQEAQTQVKLIRILRKTQRRHGLQTWPGMFEYQHAKFEICE